MPITPTSPCQERWSSLTPNAEGRHCQKCDKTVVDLTQLSRRQAERMVLKAGGELCGVLRVDTSGAPVFRREKDRAPGLLSLAAASLLAACGSTTEDSAGGSAAASIEAPSSGGDHRPEPMLVAGPSSGSLMSPMMPILDDRDAHESVSTVAPTTIAALAIDDSGEVVPTEDQRLLTEAKDESRRPTPASHRARHGGHHGSSDPGTPPVLAHGRRNNGSAPPTTTSAPLPPAANIPPDMMIMGGIAYTP